MFEAVLAGTARGRIERGDGPVFNKRDHGHADRATADEIRAAVEQLLPALVAEQLPRLVAEQLAAKQDHAPSWISAARETRETREAREAVADFEDQLSSIDFEVLNAVPKVIAVPPAVTHLKVQLIRGPEWAIRLLEPDELPALEDITRAEHGGIYHHTLGDVRATFQCLDTTELTFYQPCDCTSQCDQRDHEKNHGVDFIPGEGRTRIKLPALSGILVVTIERAWSLDVVPESSAT